MANRLAKETSPYLLQHAENPVDWYPWGAEAFAAAGREDKPIFLSVGYAACHWCHVMAHESFEDPGTADLMNEHFINIKVDREERPDIDAIYMDAVVSLTGSGGWPMSVFLTPEGKPFYGGTYFPPQRRYQMPSFRELLIYISRLWHEDREQLLRSAHQITEHISPARLPDPTEAESVAGILAQAMEQVLHSYDWRHGGWGAGPKFPQSTTIDFLLLRSQVAGDKLALEMAVHALRAMASGGIHDHLAGGFHRYAVDDNWLVPHFEKMLYDNALLSNAYLHAWQISGEELFRNMAEECLDFLIHNMRHSQGGLFSSIDADSEGVEGKYYVWTEAEIRSALPEGEIADTFVAAYGVTKGGNFEDANILHRTADDEALAGEFGISTSRVRGVLGEAKEILAARRAQRVPPAVDDKVLTSWNGLALVSLSEAARALGREDYKAAAQELASFLLEDLNGSTSLRRSWRQGSARFKAFLEDHAALGLGLLALYQLDFDSRWYQAAKEQAEVILAHFSDPEGGFFDTRDDQEPLISRPKSLQDSPMPSPNTLAVWLLFKMEAFSGDAQYGRPAEEAALAMASNAARHPTAFAGWLESLQLLASPKLQLALIGEPASKGFRALYDAVRSRYLPNLVIGGAAPGEIDHPALLSGRDRIDGKPGAYLCQSFACNMPTSAPEELIQQLEEYL
jgi:uncharacterized protein YyaL (SSP411 family)